MEVNRSLLKRDKEKEPLFAIEIVCLSYANMPPHNLSNIYSITMNHFVALIRAYVRGAHFAILKRLQIEVESAANQIICIERICALCTETSKSYL